MTTSKASLRLMIQALPLAIFLGIGSLFVLNLVQAAVNGSQVIPADRPMITELDAKRP